MIWQGRQVFERLLARIEDVRLQQALRASYVEIERLALTDPLTGCANRLYMEQWCLTTFAEQQKQPLSYTLLLVDIDHFKEINDRYGHQVGDRVLQHVTATMSHAIEEHDFIARYGGDEFMIVLMGRDPFEAMAKAEQLRLLVAGLSHETMGTLFSVTISIGMLSVEGPSLYPARQASWASQSSWERAEVTGVEMQKLASYMQRLDGALYEAKQGGRNRIVATHA